MLALHGKAGDFMAEPPLTPEAEEEGERIGISLLLTRGIFQRA